MKHLKAKPTISWKIPPRSFSPIVLLSPYHQYCPFLDSDVRTGWWSMKRLPAKSSRVTRGTEWDCTSFPPFNIVQQALSVLRSKPAATLLRIILATIRLSKSSNTTAIYQMQTNQNWHWCWPTSLSRDWNSVAVDGVSSCALVLNKFRCLLELHSTSHFPKLKNIYCI